MKTPQTSTHEPIKSPAADQARQRAVTAAIREEISEIPFPDTQECKEISATLAWIDSGADIYRKASPATPRQHLTACFICTDGEEILLVDHIKSGLWLPAGAHVEPGEHPRATVQRVIEDEFGISASFKRPYPLMLTRYDYTPEPGEHRDVALWYALQATRQQTYNWDRSDIYNAEWFRLSEVPFQHCDPNVERFVHKLKRLQATH